MKKAINISMFFLISLAFLYVIFTYIIPLIGGLIIGGIFSPPISKAKMGKIFYKDHETLIVVRDYLINLENDDFYISNASDLESINPDIKKDINTLFEKGYKVIIKDKNQVRFQRWSNLDTGRGIIYLITGNESDLQPSMHIESLGEENWYYYEEGS